MATKTDLPERFTALGFLWRFLAALALVLISFNPSGTSAYHWVVTAVGAGTFGAVHGVVLVLLLIGWVVFWVATWRALDTFGVFLAFIALGAIVWLLIDFGIITANTVSMVTWISLVCLAAVMAIGLSWAHIWRRITGQQTVEDTDD
ncbi:MAG TPA: DUF6524 family protein [Woeseiaceae bacterium]|nr:DUF6524 family protein [Woeseiaceae bacterium]